MSKILLVILLIVAVGPFVEVLADPEPDLISILGDSFASSARYFTKTVGNILNIKNPVKPTLCGLRTNELIEHYGYEAEEHKIITEDGYMLTVFRCNSKRPAFSRKKAVILQHGLLSSSDDYCVNIPEQALPYILADAGYDIWLENSRGNIYSRQHIIKNPDMPSSGFWDFSWYEMGIYDHPAVIDYILKETGNEKLYFVGHSQGTTSIMVLLSEKPEYNAKIYAASLMAPVGYMNNSDWMLRSLTLARPFLELYKNIEFLPRETVMGLPASFCDIDLTNFCDNMINLISGPSDSQRNNTMLPSLICHTPSGASINQFLHYGLEIRYGYFGKYMEGMEVPSDFELWRITTPISLHFSPADKLATWHDVQRLIPQLSNSLAYTQIINEKDFNHVDFIWGIDSASLIYPKIKWFFEKFQ
ncbi:lipase 3-like [Sitodiplosis mosellana]|uniref:lipase 3-like n=1 Tax=Sitodiplosis mosellana TaxID=263140 RepID=UPI002444FF74|nr:lipase 3-like [Sitodiplosis mosellana]XP_055325869.1 lipase 3-like [Sitodiplosis mosellana]